MASFADRRALTLFNKLRVIPFKKYSGEFNMALDFYLASKVTETKIPVLRFYGWDPPCISLGFHQNIDLVLREQINDHDIQCVRRPTGGSAILHAQELTYSFIIPKGFMGHLEMYQLFHEILAASLIHLGYKVELHNRTDEENYIKMGTKAFACFNRPAFTEIKFAGKKVVGSAQKIYTDSILQHGSILIGREQDRIIEFLNVTEEKKIAYKKELQEKSIALNDIQSEGINEIKLSEQIVREFSEKGPRNIFYHYPDTQEIHDVRQIEGKFQI